MIRLSSCQSWSEVQPTSTSSSTSSIGPKKKVRIGKESQNRDELFWRTHFQTILHTYYHKLIRFLSNTQTAVETSFIFFSLFTFVNSTAQACMHACFYKLTCYNRVCEWEPRFMLSGYHADAYYKSLKKVGLFLISYCTSLFFLLQVRFLLL